MVPCPEISFLSYFVDDLISPTFQPILDITVSLKYKFVINIDCQLNSIWSYLVDKPLGMPMRGYLD